MSISRSDWEKTFNQIRARLAHTVPPVRYPVVGPSVIGVKAGLSLVALSPEPTAPKIVSGQECYNSSGTLVTGMGALSALQKAVCNNSAIGTGGAHITVLTYNVEAGITKVAVVAFMYANADGGNEYLYIKKNNGSLINATISGRHAVCSWVGDVATADEMTIKADQDSSINYAVWGRMYGIEFG